MEGGAAHLVENGAVGATVVVDALADKLHLSRGETVLKEK
jgi:hypothetical protein